MLCEPSCFARFVCSESPPHACGIRVCCELRGLCEPSCFPHACELRVYCELRGLCELSCFPHACELRVCCEPFALESLSLTFCLAFRLASDFSFGFWLPSWFLVWRERMLGGPGALRALLILKTRLGDACEGRGVFFGGRALSFPSNPAKCPMSNVQCPMSNAKLPSGKLSNANAKSGRAGAAECQAAKSYATRYLSLKQEQMFHVKHSDGSQLPVVRQRVVQHLACQCPGQAASGSPTSRTSGIWRAPIPGRAAFGLPRPGTDAATAQADGGGRSILKGRAPRLPVMPSGDVAMAEKRGQMRQKRANLAWRCRFSSCRPCVVRLLSVPSRGYPSECSPSFRCRSQLNYGQRGESLASPLPDVILPYEIN